MQGVGRIFGPEGIGRLADTRVHRRSLEGSSDPASVVGIGRVAGSLASDDRFGDLLFLFGVVNVFVGLLNLLPLPPFDGGHLAVLAIEKIRGRPVDMRKVIPVSAAVAAFFIIFTVAVVYVDLVKPPSLAPRSIRAGAFVLRHRSRRGRRHDFSTRSPKAPRGPAATMGR